MRTRPRIQRPPPRGRARVVAPLIHEAASGLHCLCASPHAVSPLLGVATLANAPQVVLTLYSDRPIEAGGASDQVAADSLDPCGCAICSADGKKRRLCIRARANLPCEAFRHRVGGAIGPRPLRTCSDECVR